MYVEAGGNDARGLEDLSDGEIISALRRIVLPPELVPLSRERQPFKSLRGETILRYVRFFKQYPEALGRLSYAVKSAFGLLKPCPTQFTIKESHFDLNTLQPDLLDQLIPLGFEPDHFATLNPRESASVQTAEPSASAAEKMSNVWCAFATGAAADGETLQNRFFIPLPSTYKHKT